MRAGGHSARAVALAVLAAAAFPAPPAPGEEPVDKSPNVTAVALHPYLGSSEIAFDGPFVIGGQIDGRTVRGETPSQGGVKVFDTRGGGLSLAGELACPGNDNYVDVVRPGIVAVGHHASRCSPGARGDGMFLVDITDPSSPAVIDGSGVRVVSSHTLSVHPSGSYVYVNPGGLANGNGFETIVDVSDPSNVSVAATFRTSRIGCHDLGFHPTLSLAYCAGAGEVQVWDVTDPIAPVTVGRIVNPAIEFPHNALVSPDGATLVINDEAFAVHECLTGTSAFGSLWIYDLTVPTIPVPVGRIAPPTSRGGVGTYVGWQDSWCTAHNYGFVPGTDIVVSSWFTGGTTLHDISNPTLPVLVAYYKPADTMAYSSYWYDGRVYVSDRNRGLEVLSVAGIAGG